jgi:hypothetical protein
MFSVVRTDDYPTIHEKLHRKYGLNVSLVFPCILWRPLQLLEERRLQAAAETLDSLQREMNLAAEHALAMEEQKQHQVGHAYDSRQRALAAQAERLAESSGAAVMSPAAAGEVPAAGSLTHRITSIEKIIATAENQAQDRCDLHVKIWTRAHYHGMQQELLKHLGLKALQMSMWITCACTAGTLLSGWPRLRPLPSLASGQVLSSEPSLAW